MSEFVEYLAEVFEEFGRIEVRRMFGGYGIYHDGVMFGLVADEALYLKADEGTRALFESRGLDQFEYMKRGKPVRMSYYLAPDEIFDDAEMATVWARRAWRVAFDVRSRGREKRRR